MLRVLMTVDAVGGVWPQVRDAAAMLTANGMTCRLLGFGPAPEQSATLPPGVDLVWADQPLDWLVTDEAALASVGPTIMAHAQDWKADIVHLSAPTQAAGLPPGPVVVVQSHSCVPTWWAAVKGGDLPAEWKWQVARNQAGLRRADGVIVPSVTHGRALRDCYGSMTQPRVVSNACVGDSDVSPIKQDYVFAAGRWWDEGKNGALLDAAASKLSWPVLMAGSLSGPNGTRLDLRHAVALGQLPAAATRAHMARAAIFVAPSLYEPFGLAVLEAACAGASLLLADIPTFRGLWDGAAHFADPADGDAWVHAIETLAKDAPLRAYLGEQARARSATFTFDRQRRDLLAAYDAALFLQAPPIEEFV